MPPRSAILCTHTHQCTHVRSKRGYRTPHSNTEEGTKAPRQQGSKVARQLKARHCMRTHRSEIVVAQFCLSLLLPGQPVQQQFLVLHHARLLHFVPARACVRSHALLHPPRQLSLVAMRARMLVFVLLVVVEPAETQKWSLDDEAQAHQDLQQLHFEQHAHVQHHLRSYYGRPGNRAGVYLGTPHLCHHHRTALRVKCLCSAVNA